MPEILDSAAAARIALDLISVRGRTARLDASHVRLLSAACLQVLLAAQKTWAADTVTWRIENPSRALCDALALYGGDALLAPVGAGDG